MSKPLALVWLRRDLRLNDLPALNAVYRDYNIQLVFVYDSTILSELPSKDRRVQFINESIAEMQDTLKEYKTGIFCVHGDPRVEIPKLVTLFQASMVVANDDYEPAARARDSAIEEQLQQINVTFKRFRDHLVFEPSEFFSDQGRPYQVFTPFKSKWLSKYHPEYTRDQSVPLSSVGWNNGVQHLELSNLGFEQAYSSRDFLRGGFQAAESLWSDFLARISKYDERRNVPSLKGPSYLSIHFRFGTFSIRRAIREVHGLQSTGSQMWLSELIWREFYIHLLVHYPNVVHENFQPQTRHVQWNWDIKKWEAWTKGQTGYPIVDAAQRQLLSTGYMHNRLRMISASFLTKHLGIDWRQGEAFFAKHLNDFELASNNGGWQWAASTGCDAQPYFRIFNPVLQSEKFDPEGLFIDRYCPELKSVPMALKHAPWKHSDILSSDHGVVLGRDYPNPIVEHAVARLDAIKRFKAS